MNMMSQTLSDEPARERREVIRSKDQATFEAVDGILANEATMVAAKSEKRFFHAVINLQDGTRAKLRGMNLEIGPDYQYQPDGPTTE